MRLKLILKGNQRRLKRFIFLKQHAHNNESIAKLAMQQGIAIQWLEKKQTVNGNTLAQGVGALCTAFPYYAESDLQTLLKPDSLILLLDSIQDPHNLGACLRTADAVGAACVVIPQDKSAAVTDAVVKVASGATVSMPIVRVTNLVRTIEYLKTLRVWVYGAAAEGASMLYKTDFSKGSVALVMGAEGSGLRRLVRESCDELIAIPMLGSVESLNVSVATAGLFYMKCGGRKKNNDYCLFTKSQLTNCQKLSKY